MKHFIRLSVFGILLSGVGAQAATIFYQPGFTDELRTFDTVTTADALIGNMGVADSWGFSFSPSGTLYGYNRTTQSLYTINTSTAALTLVGATGLDSESLTFDLAGTQLFISVGANLYSVDPLTGAPTLVGDVGANLDGLTVAPTAGTVAGFGAYAAGTIFGVDSGSLYIIDTGTPGSTLIGSSSADETLAFGPDGTLYGQTGGAFFTISLNPIGSAAIGGSSSSSVFASAVQPGPAAVPEPATGALLGLGALAFALLRKRK